MNVNLIIIIRNINQDIIVNIVKNEEKCKICFKHFVSSPPPPPPCVFLWNQLLLIYQSSHFFIELLFVMTYRFFTMNKIDLLDNRDKIWCTHNSKISLHPRKILMTIWWNAIEMIRYLFLRILFIKRDR